LKVEDAIRMLRSDPEASAIIRDSYLGPDARSEAERFACSAEFAAVLDLLGRQRLSSLKVLDLGAGVGIAAWAFARHGVRSVFALEPDPSDEVGFGAIQGLCAGLPVQVIAGVGEAIPLSDRSVDVVYARQVLHHTRDLQKVLRECARVLRLGGLFLACREHVVDDEEQLRRFLSHHPVHRLTGGENAYRQDEYEAAISQVLHLVRSIGPWDSVINAFPAVRSREELQEFPRILLKQKLGSIGIFVGRLPGVENIIWKRLRRPVPGRAYSFLAKKTEGRHA
jgi:SAM-dependent methyltransferase